MLVPLKELQRRRVGLLGAPARGRILVLVESNDSLAKTLRGTQASTTSELVPVRSAARNWPLIGLAEIQNSNFRLFKASSSLNQTFLSEATKAICVKVADKAPIVTWPFVFSPFILPPLTPHFGRTIGVWSEANRLRRDSLASGTAAAAATTTAATQTDKSFLSSSLNRTFSAYLSLSLSLSPHQSFYDGSSQNQLLPCLVSTRELAA